MSRSFGRTFRTGSEHMTLQEKIDYMVKDLSSRGIWKSTAAPPLFRLLWHMGIDIAPPIFGNFWSNALLQGGYFAVVWGLFMWFFVWRDLPLLATVATSLAAGVFFGATMAAYFYWRRRRLGLPAWKDYPTGRA